MKKAPSTQVQEAALGAANPNTPARSVSPHRYDAAFRQQAVEHWLRSGKPGTQVAAELAS